MRYFRTVRNLLLAASIAALPVVAVGAARPVSERERFEAEQSFRRDQQQQAANDRRLREAELRLRQEEQSWSRWAPLWIAIGAALIAALSNAFVAWWNGRQQRELENRKASTSRALERTRLRAQLVVDARKAESDRMLEVIKTGDTEAAARNLQFLLSAGLITGSGLRNRLKAFLDARAPGSGPSLPAAGERFRFEAGPEDAQDVAAMKKALGEYCAYLDRVGFAQPGRDVSIVFEDPKSSTYGAYYDVAEKRIVIGAMLRKKPYVAYREYMHHLLIAASPQDYDANNHAKNIQSGLADYFPSSFMGAPYLPKSDLKFGDLDRTDIWGKNTQIWGSLFWELREALGQEAADKLLMKAWTATLWPAEHGESARAFLAVVRDRAGKAAVPTIDALLRARGFPEP